MKPKKSLVREGVTNENEQLKHRGTNRSSKQQDRSGVTA